MSWGVNRKIKKQIKTLWTTYQREGTGLEGQGEFLGFQGTCEAAHRDR
jgi:hypothetical protein